MTRSKTGSARTGWVAACIRLAFGCLLLASACARADVIIPAGGTINLAGAPLDLGCTDLVIGGTLVTSSAPINNVRSVIIQPGGVFDAGASVITVGGDWSNSGTFLAGTSQVNFVDACAATSTISGSTNFYSLSISSNIGKVFQFASGSTQSVQYRLTIHGLTGLPVQLRSTIAGQVANINLSAFQDIVHVAVTDLSATGAWLAPYLTNEGGGNSYRWFGTPESARIPTLSQGGLLVLLLLMAMLAGRVLMSRRGRA